MMGLTGTVVGASAVGIAGVARSAADNLLPDMVDTNNKHRSGLAASSAATRSSGGGLAWQMRGMPTGSGNADLVSTMHLTSSATSGSRACGRTCPLPAKQRSTALPTKSTAITRLWCCSHSRLGGSGSGPKRRRVIRNRRRSSPPSPPRRTEAKESIGDHAPSRNAVQHCRQL